MSTSKPAPPMIIHLVDGSAGSLNFKKANFDFAAGCSPSGLSSSSGSSTSACFALDAMDDPTSRRLGGRHASPAWRNIAAVRPHAPQDRRYVGMVNRYFLAPCRPESFAG